jgi:hypothetical protein
MLEEDVELAKMRLYVSLPSLSSPSAEEKETDISAEVEEECVMRGEQIANLEQDQYTGLSDLLEAELEYFSKCREILEELKDGWPSG